MPPVSKAQAGAMFAAAAGTSTLGIPKSVGQEYTADAKDMSMLPEYVQAQEGHKAKIRKAHRGRRSKGKGPKPDEQERPNDADHMQEANEHLTNAVAHPTKAGTMAHVFKALNSLKKAK